MSLSFFYKPLSHRLLSSKYSLLAVSFLYYIRIRRIPLIENNCTLFHFSKDAMRNEARFCLYCLTSYWNVTYKNVSRIFSAIKKLFSDGSPLVMLVNIVRPKTEGGCPGQECAPQVGGDQRPNNVRHRIPCRGMSSIKT